MGRLITNSLIGLLFMGILSGCLQTEESSSIVIPPGGLVAYNKDGVLDYNKKQGYKVFLRRIKDGSSELETLLEITPAFSALQIGGNMHSFILPKGITASGFVVIEAQMDVSERPLRAVVLEEGEAVHVDLGSTLVYELISTYPGLSPAQVSPANIRLLTEYVRTVVRDRIELFGLQDLKDFKVIFKFMMNALSVDPTFLKMAGDAGMAFSYDTAGNILSTPYPFNMLNNAPEIDTVKSTPFGNFIAIEWRKAKVKLEAKDRDFDLLFYYWTLDGEVVQKGDKEWEWTPDYEASRPAPYILKAYVTDGGRISEAGWDVLVQDVNRAPQLVADCPKSVKEGEVFECTIGGTDEDGDSFTYTLNPDGYINTMPTLNGQPAGTPQSAASPVIRWQPDNKDFHSKVKVMLVTLDDGKGGAQTYPITIILDAVNGYPYAILPDDTSNEFFRYTNPNDDPREMDQCRYLSSNTSTNPFDPDTDTDPAAGHVKYEFSVYFRDPDNVGHPALDDDITISIEGDARNYVRPSTPAKTVKYEMLNGVMTPFTQFRFNFFPNEAFINLMKSNPNATVSLVARDNHGKSTETPLKIKLQAGGRNLVPCPTFTDISARTFAKSPNVAISRTWTEADTGARDHQGVVQELEMFESNWVALANFSDNGVNPLSFRHFSYDLSGTYDLDYLQNATTKWKYQVVAKSPAFAMRLRYASLWAGTVVFYRDNCTIDPMAPVTIGAGTQLTTTYNASPYVPRVTFQTVRAVTLGPLDCAATIPVTAVQRTAAVGTMTVMLPAIAGVTASNPTAVNYEDVKQTTITLSRGASGSATVIPEGTTIRTNEAGGAQSIVYYVAKRYVIPATAGATTLSVDVSREYAGRIAASAANSPMVYYGSGSSEAYATRLLSSIPARAVTWAGAAVGGVSVTNFSSLYPRSGIPINTSRLRGAGAHVTGALAPTTHINRRNDYRVAYKFKLRALDGRIPTSNVISNMSVIRFGEEAPGVTAMRSQPGFSDIRIQHSSFTSPHIGRVTFYRAANGPDVTIPSGLYISTDEREIFRVVSPGVVTSAGGNRIDLTVVRDYASTYRPFDRTAIFYFDDTADVFSVSTPQAQYDIDAGSWSEIPLSATDNDAFPYDPLNPYDRYRFCWDPWKAGAKKPAGAAPTNCNNVAAANYKLCRESFAENANPAVCTQCTAFLRDQISHEASRHCYLRFKPEVDDIAETFVFTVIVNDSGAYAQRSSPKQVSVFVKEANVAPQFMEDENYSAPLAGGTGTPTSSTNVRTRFAENQTGRLTVYAKDTSKGTSLKSFRFSLLNTVYELKNGAVLPKPAGLTIGATTLAFDPSGIGSTGSAVIEWTPTDADAKALSSAEGFIIGVEAKDSLSFPTQSMSSIAYFKVFVDNANNVPVISPMSGVTDDLLKVNADTYVSKTFRVHDLDLYSPTGLSFTTFITACRDSSGQGIVHPTLDALPLGTVAPADPLDPRVPAAPLSCHFTGDDWAEGTFDRHYAGNRNVGATACRSGANESQLNVDLAVPKLTRIGGPYNDAGRIAYDFKFEWCPQKGHVGEYNVTLGAVDNGDLSLANVLASRRRAIRPLALKVSAPVFFKSPLLAEDRSPLHSMRQVAAIPSAPFRYPTIVENSAGNQLEYTVVAAPRACGASNGVCIDSSGVITWTPLSSDRTLADDSRTWHRIEVRVRDTVTNDVDQVHFLLQVQDPALPPYEELPVIQSSSGPSLMSEGVSETFSVTAMDPNANDVLHYRWYLDGRLIEDHGPSFTWRPKPMDGSVDLDGGGPLKIGEHVVRVEVTDGNFTVSKDWLVKVKNNILSPVLALNMPAERKTLDPGDTFTNFVWNHEVAGRTVQGGKQVEALFFAGSYKKSGTLKSFAWMLEWVDDKLSMTGRGGSSWNFFEGLAWNSGDQVRRVAVETDPTTQALTFYVASRLPKYGPYNTSQDAVRLSGDLASKASLTAADACSACQGKLYMNAGDGDRLHATWGAHAFYVGDSGRELIWDQNSQSSSVTTFASLPVGYQISGLAVNTQTKRLYVSAANNTTAGNFVHVYNIASVQTNVAPSGTPLVSFDVSGADPADPTMPSAPGAISIDTTKTGGRENQVFVFLRGTGGMAVIQDPTAGPPAGLQFLAVGELAPSPSDAPGLGVRMVYQADSDLLLGVSREGRQAFAIDPVTKVIYSSGMSADIDSVISVPTSGRLLMVDRQTLRVFGAR